MLKKLNLSKIFYLIVTALVLLAVGLFVVHSYMGGESLLPARNILPPTSLFMNEDKDTFTIALISDTGTHNHVLEKAIDSARQNDNPDFIMYLGDFVSDRRPANFYWMLHEIERHLGGTPFYMIPGNHDVEKRGNIDKRYYRAVMGPAYYWFGYGDTLFIAMDSSDEIEDEQFEWLADTLKHIRPLFKNCILFGHMPPKNVPGAEKHMMKDDDVQKFESIIRGHKINAMFFGHVHYFSKDEFAGIPIYTTPSSGQTARFTDIGKFGYISLRIGPRGIEDITPKYIKFSGPRREYFEAWFFRYVFTQRIRELINAITIAAFVFFVAGLITKYYARRKK